MLKKRAENTSDNWREEMVSDLITYNWRELKNYTMTPFTFLSLCVCEYFTKDGGQAGESLKRSQRVTQMKWSRPQFYSCRSPTTIIGLLLLSYFWASYVLTWIILQQAYTSSLKFYFRTRSKFNGPTKLSTLVTSELAKALRQFDGRGFWLCTKKKNQYINTNNTRGHVMLCGFSIQNHIM